MASRAPRKTNNARHRRQRDLSRFVIDLLRLERGNDLILEAEAPEQLVNLRVHRREKLGIVV